jgi:signal transduction histidine kinase
MRLSVTARLALLAFGLILVSNLGLVALVWNQIHDNAIEALRRDTVEQADALGEVWHSGGTAALSKAVDDAYNRGDETMIAMVVDNRGNRIVGRGPEIVALGRLQPSGFRIVTVGHAPPWSRREAGIAIRRIGQQWLISGRLLDDWQQEQHAIERALVVAGLLSLALGGIGGLVLTRYVTGRLDRIAGVMDTVADGDLSRRVDLAAAGGDAFDRLAAQLNAMLDRIERLMTELRVMTDSLAHDLRSPLARLRSKAESAILQADPAARDTALGGLIAETDLVMQMLSMLLEISRSESVSRDRFVRIDPAELIEEIADLYAPVAEDGGMAFTVVTSKAVRALPLHRELMSQAITNLIDNALRHAADGGAITLRLTSDATTLRFQVEDRGPGIAVENHEQARRRFGRLDDARTKPGAGLGLALVEAVARLHGGRLELADNAPGLIASIMLPMAGTPVS